MNQAVHVIALFVTLAISGCANLGATPQPAPLTQAELKSELAASESRRDALAAQNQQALGEQTTRIEQLRSDLEQVKTALNEVKLRVEKLPTPPAKAPPSAPPPRPAAGTPLNGKLLVGEAEWVWVDAAHAAFRARVDTGAATSSISAQDITLFERDGKNWVRFQLAHKDAKTPIQIEAPLLRYAQVRQASSKKMDRRPVVRLAIRLGSLTEKAEFTLRDRSDMSFPVLLGREFLKDIAVVDVGRQYIHAKPDIKDVK